MTVVTRIALAASPARAWRALRFYEEVEARPPLLLRALLPVPLRAEGRTFRVGDEVRCLYRTGHLVKRITRVEDGSLYAFDVVEQALPIAGGLRLRGGWYAMRSLSDGRVEVETGTRYESARRPRWIFGRLEAAVCHRFHRHMLHAMLRDVGAS